MYVCALFISLIALILEVIFLYIFCFPVYSCFYSKHLWHWIQGQRWVFRARGPERDAPSPENFLYTFLLWKWCILARSERLH